MYLPDIAAVSAAACAAQPFQVAGWLLALLTTTLLLPHHAHSFPNSAVIMHTLFIYSSFFIITIKESSVMEEMEDFLLCLGLDLNSITLFLTLSPKLSNHILRFMERLPNANSILQMPL